MISLKKQRNMHTHTQCANRVASRNSLGATGGQTTFLNSRSVRSLLSSMQIRKRKVRMLETL